MKEISTYIHYREFQKVGVDLLNLWFYEFMKEIRTYIHYREFQEVGVDLLNLWFYEFMD